MNRLAIFILSFCCLCISSLSFGQEKDKKPAFQLSGGLNLNSTYYTVKGIESRRDPFYWMASANLNLTWNSPIGLISAPFSASFSQQEQFNFNQPFNQYGISPQWKWLTAHLGYRTMNFSEFTLGGNMFLGVGIEAKPPKSMIHGSLVYGRFAKATEGGTDGVSLGIPTYERWGYGVKTTINKSLKKGRRVNIGLSIFKAEDDPNSLPDSVAQLINPAENIVIGTDFRLKLHKNLSINGEYALSAYTMNTLNPSYEGEEYTLFNNLGSLFERRLSTQVNDAIKLETSYSLGGNDVIGNWKIKLGYRRVDPEYKTMGSIFLNNDIQDVSTTLSWRKVINKEEGTSVNTNIKLGVQQNNLDAQLATEQQRLAGALSINGTIRKNTSFNLGYSNFTANTKVFQVIDPLNSLGDRLDSLNLVQVNNSGNFSVNFNKPDANRSIFISGNIQQSISSNGQASTFFNTNAGWQKSNKKTGYAFNTGINYNVNLIEITSTTQVSKPESNDSPVSITEIQTTQALGPTAGVSKQFSKRKIRLNLSLSYLYAMADVENSSTANAQLSFNKGIGNHSTFNVGLIYLKRMSEQQAFDEFRGQFSYGYKFATGKK